MKDKREDKDYTNENNQMLGISRSVLIPSLQELIGQMQSLWNRMFFLIYIYREIYLLKATNNDVIS